MKILRWILGGVLALYALLSAVTVVGFATAYKLGLMAADKPELKKIEPYMAGVSWFELALGSLTVILLALAAWRRLGETGYAHSWRSHTWAVLAEVGCGALAAEEADGGPAVPPKLDAALRAVLRMQTRALLILLAGFAVFTPGTLF